MDIIYSVYVQIGLWLNLLGEYYFFYHWIYYDKFLHFSVPFMIAMVTYKYLKRNSKNINNDMVVFFFVLGVCALFEIFEYFQSGILKFPSVGVYANNLMTRWRIGIPHRIGDIVAAVCSRIVRASAGIACILSCGKTTIWELLNKTIERSLVHAFYCSRKPGVPGRKAVITNC